jgi:hypothetical protein
MKEIALALAPYGFPGALILVAALLIWKLIEHGFDFKLQVGKPRKR